LFSRIRAFIQRHIIADVPNDLSACLDCDALECIHGKWETCPHRLKRAADLEAAGRLTMPIDHSGQSADDFRETRAPLLVGFTGQP
jgi:hypothetical protein